MARDYFWIDPEDCLGEFMNEVLTNEELDRFYSVLCLEASLSDEPGIIKITTDEIVERYNNRKPLSILSVDEINCLIEKLITDSGRIDIDSNGNIHLLKGVAFTEDHPIIDEISYITKGLKFIQEKIIEIYKDDYFNKNDILIRKLHRIEMRIRGIEESFIELLG